MEHPRLTTDDIAHMAEGNSPATVDLDYDEACTAMAQELLAIRRASQAAPELSDGTCAECGCAPVNADSLCATCVDERHAPAPSDGLQKLMGLSRWSPKGLPKNRGGVCMGVAKKGDWINRKEALIALGALTTAPAAVLEVPPMSDEDREELMQLARREAGALLLGKVLP